jgi:hypothetical protein
VNGSHDFARRRRRHLLCALALLAAAVLPAAFPGTVRATFGSADPLPAREWPRTWDGHDLRPLALTAVEERFAQAFPGRIARFDGGHFVLVLREVQSPTRQLHPATDCYRGLGYRIEKIKLERDARGRLWRCFLAIHDGRAVRVCERIEGAGGDAYTDASAWFWSAALGRAHGPWLAVTRVERL